MSIKIPPHILSSIDWANPLEDPLFRQFIPLKSTFMPDHPMLDLDPLHERADSPVEGLVHRYHDKCLFLGTSFARACHLYSYSYDADCHCTATTHCPLYCRFCTRSYGVGAPTDTTLKCALKPGRRRWDAVLEYIAKTPVINDVVISGGDSYMLQPHQLRYIGHTLLAIPHIRRFRIATKGLAVCPSRTLDPDDVWTGELIELVNQGKKCGKHVTLHTHFNHPNEFSWVTREAAQRLFENGVIVRNQTVLLRGVNDTAETMGALIRELSDNNIFPVIPPFFATLSYGRLLKFP